MSEVYYMMPDDTFPVNPGSGLPYLVTELNFVSCCCDPDADYYVTFEGYLRAGSEYFYGGVYPVNLVSGTYHLWQSADGKRLVSLTTGGGVHVWLRDHPPPDDSEIDVTYGNDSTEGEYTYSSELITGETADCYNGITLVRVDAA